MHSEERVIFSTLWPKNAAVLSQLIARGHRRIATLNMFDTPLLRAAVTNAGGDLLLLNERQITQSRAAYIQATAASIDSALSERLSAVPLTMSGWSQQCPDAMLSQIVKERVRAETLQIVSLIEALNGLADRNTVEAVIVNETDLWFSRIAVRWAARRGIPSFMVDHGAHLGADHTVTAEPLTDFFFVFGQRSADNLLERDIAPERIHMSGNPAWDEYPPLIAQQDNIREQISGEFSFDPTLPVVMFGTTWIVYILRLQEDQVFAETTRAFLRAVHILRSRGVRFNCVVKDRASNASFGKDAVERIADDEQSGPYCYMTAPAEHALLAADVLIAFDSNLFIEAIFAGVPAINMWSPSSWLMGPCYEAADGIPTVTREEPQRLADLIERMLTDAQFRTETIARMSARGTSFHRPLDGRSAERCAEFISHKSHESLEPLASHRTRP